MIKYYKPKYLIKSKNFNVPVAIDDGRLSINELLMRDLLLIPLEIKRLNNNLLIRKPFYCMSYY